MSIWAHIDVMQNGPNYVKTNCNSMVLVSTYSPGDSYATVTGNILAEVAMTSTDFTLGGTSGANATMTTASGKQDPSANASGGGASMHIVFRDTVNSKVLLVTEETSDQTITINNPVNFPVIVATFVAPVAA